MAAEPTYVVYMICRDDNCKGDDNGCQFQIVGVFSNKLNAYQAAWRAELKENHGVEKGSEYSGKDAYDTCGIRSI